jgi:hypothetical protein
MSETANAHLAGPSSFENWKAALAGTPLRSVLDYPLFTDARVIDELAKDLGPYQLLNAVPITDEQTVHPAAFLRIEYYLEYEPKVELKTDVTRYHGGGLQDEIAALVSLCLGIRLKAGGFTHVYEPNKDPRGRPVSWEAHHRPMLVKPEGQRPILPSVLGQHNLREAALVSLLPKLTALDCVALIRSARMYQDALWIAESQPEMSWLLLVSSIETAANHWKKTLETPLERMQSFNPQLVTVLGEAGGAELTERVAVLIADFMGSTAKFTDFVLKFLPEPPVKRPADFVQHQWDKVMMRKSLKKIYN